MSQEYGPFEHLELRRDGRLLTLTLNRPKVRNAINAQMSRELTAALKAISRDDSVGAVLVHGAGKSFSVGGDINTLASRELSPTEQVTSTFASKDLLYTFLEVQQPVVAVVHGHAMGLGATIALVCDIVLAAEDAVFADSHVNIGLVAGDGGAALWPLLLPFGVAKYHLFTGARISGLEAAQRGMIYQAAPADAVFGEAHRMAKDLAEGPTMAIRWTKVAINQVLRARLDLCLEIGLALEGASFLSADFKEASRAFLEKRPPTFRGR